MKNLLAIAVLVLFTAGVVAAAAFSGDARVRAVALAITAVNVWMVHGFVTRGRR